MSVQSVSVTLSSGTATVVAGDGIHGTLRVTVRNRGTGTAYFGTTGVTTGGYELTTGDNPLQLVLAGGETLYACCTGAAVLGVFRNFDTT